MPRRVRARAGRAGERGEPRHRHPRAHARDRRSRCVRARCPSQPAARPSRASRPPRASSPASSRSRPSRRARERARERDSRRVLTAHWDDPSVIAPAGYEAAGGYRALRTALGMSGRRADPAREGLRPAWARGSGLPDGHEVVVRASRHRQAHVRRGELRRVRARHLQQPRARGARAARADRGHRDRRQGDRLPPRASSTSAGEYLWQATGAAARARRGLRGRLPRPGHHGRRLRPRHRAAPGRGRVHLRRGDGAALEPRGLPGPAAAAAAVPGGRGSVRVADGDQQRRDADERAAHREQRARTGSRRSAPRRRPAPRCSRSAARWSAPATTSSTMGTPAARAARGARRRRARRQGAQGVDAGRVLDPVPHGRPPRRRPRLRVGDGSGLAARHRRDHGARRDRLHGGGRAPPRGVLRARVLRQVHAVPRGNLVGHARARSHRGRVRARRGPAASWPTWARTSCSGRSARSPTAPSRRSNRRCKHFMDEYEAHIREGRCPVTGIGPGRDAEPEQEAVTFAATGPFEIQGALS